MSQRAWLLVALALASACAAQHEPVAFEGEAERSLDQPVTEAAAPEPGAAPGAGPERSLADIERELAVNEAKLRALGVGLPADRVDLAGGDASGGAIQPDAAPAERSSPGGRSIGDGAGKAGSGGSGGVTKSEQPRPASPSTAPQAEPERKPSRQDRKQGKPKDKANKKKSEDADAFAQPPPDEAKAAPLSPNKSAELDAATRCEQVCDLGQITCELSVQICELAARHDADDDYQAACERASEDCTVAQEACDACEPQ